MSKKSKTAVEETGGAEITKTDALGITVVGSAFESALVPYQPGEIDVNRTTAVRDGVVKLAEAGGKLEIMAGALLAEVRDGEYWKLWTRTEASTGLEKAFVSFEDYLDTEVPFKRRKAFYLLSIYDKFVKELAIPLDVLKTVEWSKAKELTSIITKDNWESLLKAVATMSVRDVIAMVAAVRAKSSMSVTGSTDAEAGHSLVDPDVDESPSSTVRMSFNLFKPQAENLKTALEIAKFEAGSDKPGHLIDMIATDYIAGRVAASTESFDALCGRLDMIIGNIERAFGVKLEVVGTTVKTPTAK